MDDVIHNDAPSVSAHPDSTTGKAVMSVFEKAWMKQNGFALFVGVQWDKIESNGKTPPCWGWQRYHEYILVIEGSDNGRFAGQGNPNLLPTAKNIVTASRRAIKETPN